MNTEDTTPPLSISPTTPHFTSILSAPTRPIPRLPPEERVSSTEPKHKFVTTEYFQKCFGFRNIDPILKNITSQSKNTVTVRDTGKHPILSRGETATLPKYKKNSEPVPKPPEYGQVWHYDIVYGNGRAIGGIYYALFFVDRKSPQKKLIGLKDLSKETLQRALKTFVRKVGFYPDELIADRDFKLIGTNIDDIMEPHTQVLGAPGGRQNQNGLSEANWRYICNIARNYLVEHLLPSEFWFFAISYAVQVSNYIPIRTKDKQLTTPHYLAYRQHPDYRKLIPLFSSAYVKVYESAEGNTFQSQTVKAILVGNDEKSDGRIFYNPATKKILGSSDYRLNISGPSGPMFNLKYEQPTTYTLYNDDEVESETPAFDIGQTVHTAPTYLQHPLRKATVIDIPFKRGEMYKLQLSETGSIINALPHDILPYDPSSLTDDSGPSLHHQWFKHKAKCTLFLTESMSVPKHGIIIKDDDQWKFHQGHTLISKSKTKKPIIIPLLSDVAKLETLLESNHLIEGWHNSKVISQRIEQKKTFTFIARRVTFMQSSDPAHLTTDSVQAKLDKLEQPDIIGFSRKVSAAGLSSLN